MFGPKLIILLGGIVALGAGVPLAVLLGEEKIALHSENSIYKRWVSPKGPVLDCYDWERHYQVFLDFSGGGTGKESDVPILKIAVLRDIREGNRRINTSKEGKWSKWRITNLSPKHKGVYMETPPAGHDDWGERQWAEQVTCHSTQLEWTNPEQDKWVDGKDIKLSLSGENCKVEIGKEGRKDCNIDMSVAGDTLRWKEGFKPQAHFRAIS
ncbi:hypothetical protein DNK47_00745 [Mycoplasma wenyonii]|uniref:Uncharacterized protein n=1 Tax=Mycoplasma wenyonii TaxID=65123 RepID=A0A328PJQ1_9MOLU|nr:hypothetical protein [Mycoplasma wenyonii]RAO95363.1 hypothetical protein DNK47_00745 [Mycoplasma wenyonii]